VLANRGLCSQSLPAGFEPASDGYCFSITSVSENLPCVPPDLRVKGAFSFSKVFSIARFPNAKCLMAFENKEARQGFADGCERLYIRGAVHVRVKASINRRLLPNLAEHD